MALLHSRKFSTPTNRSPDCGNSSTASSWYISWANRDRARACAMCCMSIALTVASSIAEQSAGSRPNERRPHTARHSSSAFAWASDLRPAVGDQFPRHRSICSNWLVATTSPVAAAAQPPESAPSTPHGWRSGKPRLAVRRPAFSVSVTAWVERGAQRSFGWLRY